MEAEAEDKIDFEEAKVKDEESSKSGDVAGLTAMLAKLSLYEKNTQDGDASAWAGQFTAFLCDCPKE